MKIKNPNSVILHAPHQPVQQGLQQTLDFCEIEKIEQVSYPERKYSITISQIEYPFHSRPLHNFRDGDMLTGFYQCNFPTYIDDHRWRKWHMYYRMAHSLAEFHFRSEERRVGKEGRVGGSAEEERRK